MSNCRDIITGMLEGGDGMEHLTTAIESWLRLHEFDGLFLQDGCDNCGCEVDDFAPCGDGPFPECQPAYKDKNDGLMYPALEASDD